MTVFVVRHADAKSRAGWDGADHLRPLTKTGRRQADGLVNVLGSASITKVLTSPAVRCVDTIAPLASKAGVNVELTETLFEGAPTPDVYELVRALVEHKGDCVLCTHGDVVPELLRAATRDGCKLKDDLRWPKGSTWALTGNSRRITQARYLPPPA